MSPTPAVGVEPCMRLHAVLLAIALGITLAVGASGQTPRAPDAPQFLSKGWLPYAQSLVRQERAVGVHPLGVIVAVLFASKLFGVAGALLAVPALRVRGPYLAMVTIAFAFIVEHGIVEMRELTGGQNGIMGIAAPAFDRLPGVVRRCALGDRADDVSVLAGLAVLRR